jgi:hypothetical protein
MSVAEAVLRSGDADVPLGSIDLEALEREIRRLAEHPDAFGRNAGLDLAAFLRDRDAFSAAMLVDGLRILVSAFRRSANGIENEAAGLECRVMDALANARLARQRAES